MGPVERAVKMAVHMGDKLHTPAQGAEFEVAKIDRKGIVLLLGKKQAWTPLKWDCLEGIPGFLKGRGWVEIGSKFDTSADPQTLDGYLKRCIKRATAGWVAVILERAGVVEIDRSRPIKVRVKPFFFQ